MLTVEERKNHTMSHKKRHPVDSLTSGSSRRLEQAECSVHRLGWSASCNLIERSQAPWDKPV